MGNGNFDDPGANHHGSGQPFAWDFGYSNSDDPDGTLFGQIFAARAGTVIEMRDGQTGFINFADPILGPGNFLVIRHADNTISAYDHLKVNTIQVTVGQYVEQGTWLGIVGNTGTTSGTVHCHFECHTWWTPGADIPSDAGGASLLIHFEDLIRPAWRPIDGDAFSALAHQFRQDGWRSCTKCAGLYYAYQGAVGVCPKDGAGHTSGGGNYTVSDDAGAAGQPLWKWCHKCAVMFYSGNSGSKCPVTSPTNAHDGTGSNSYHLIENIPSDPGQHHWRWCSKCQGLWFGDAATSACPATGLHSVGSGDYSIALNPEDTQQDWRWCNRCQGIFYAPNGNGVCKAGSGGHSSSGSSNYTLCVDVNPVNASSPSQTGWQAGWAYCNQCGLLWMGANSGSHCPATSGAHSKSISGNYFLINGNSSGGQAGWRWCGKCQGLWMSLNSGSKCGFDGLAHSTSGSGAYQLIND